MSMTYVAYVYIGALVLLAVRTGWFQERLFRYIYARYPEESKAIRSLAWQRYPWSEKARVVRALIKSQAPTDPALGQRARKARCSMIEFLAWFGLGLVAFAGIVMYLTIWRGR